MEKLVIGFRINKYLLADSDSVFTLNEISKKKKTKQKMIKFFIGINK